MSNEKNIVSRVKNLLVPSVERANLQFDTMVIFCFTLLLRKTNMSRAKRLNDALTFLYLVWSISYFGASVGSLTTTVVQHHD